MQIREVTAIIAISEVMTMRRRRIKMSAMREFSQDYERVKLVNRDSERERNSLRGCIMTGLYEAISGASRKT